MWCSLMPLDPTAWLVLLNQHSAALPAQQAAQLASAPQILPAQVRENATASNFRVAMNNGRIKMHADRGALWCFSHLAGYCIVSSVPASRKIPSAQQGGSEEHASANSTLVRDLMCAAVHSRAAYGYAMQAGHISSLLSFALLQTVSSPSAMWSILGVDLQHKLYIIPE